MNTLPASAAIGHVELRLQDRQGTLAFYRDLLGWRVIADDGASVRLSASGAEPASLVLRFDPHLQPRPQRAAGLYHVAILLPNRPALANVLRRLAIARYPIQGAGDHLVSEAIYLADPEGNGLELYQDRPRATWQWDGDQVRMDTLPVNLEDLLAQATATDEGHLPDGTRIGHVHLAVSALDRVESFYHQGIGMVRAAGGPFMGALFLAAPGYHHHVGANIWQTRGAAPTPANSVGLEAFSVVVPDAADLAPVAEALAAEGWPVQRLPGGLESRDADGIRVQVLFGG